MRLDLFGSDWRALFLINLPIGVFALVLGMQVLPDGAPSHRGLRLDGVGTALLATASFLVVFPLVDGRTQGWPTWMFALLAASVPMLTLFVLQQRTRLRRLKLIVWGHTADMGRCPAPHQTPTLRPSSEVSAACAPPTAVAPGLVDGAGQGGIGRRAGAPEPVPLRHRRSSPGCSVAVSLSLLRSRV